MTSPTAIGAALKEHARRLKLNVSDLCETAGIARQTWYDLTAGKHPPSHDTQRGIARAFGWGADWYDRMVAGEQPADLAAVLTDLLHQPNGAALLERLELLASQVRDLTVHVAALRSELDALKSDCPGVPKANG